MACDLGASYSSLNRFKRSTASRGGMPWERTHTHCWTCSTWWCCVSFLPFKSSHLCNMWVWVRRRLRLGHHNFSDWMPGHAWSFWCVLRETLYRCQRVHRKPQWLLVVKLPHDINLMLRRSHDKRTSFKLSKTASNHWTMMLIASTELSDILTMRKLRSTHSPLAFSHPSSVSFLAWSLFSSSLPDQCSSWMSLHVTTEEGKHVVAELTSTTHLSITQAIAVWALESVYHNLARALRRLTFCLLQITHPKSFLKALTVLMRFFLYWICFRESSSCLVSLSASNLKASHGLPHLGRENKVCPMTALNHDASAWIEWFSVPRSF